MADNVPLAQGPLVVATKGDYANVQHQEVALEFLSAGDQPINVATGSPLPTADDGQIALLMALLVEQRITNELLYAWLNTETEPLEMLRAKYGDFPVKP